MTIHDAGAASRGPADAAFGDDGGDADADLVLRTRSGDRAAFAELWRRHYRSGMTVARSVTSSLDPDDLVQEAYTRIYQSIVDGGGPTGSFRAYLFTCIRNTAAGWGRARRETTIDALETVEDPATTDQATAEALDRSLTHRAFQTLPTRWQEVLWYSEIEQMKPAEIAPLLGMKPTAVAQLTFRAREGLREAWIQSHLQSVVDGSDCQWTIDHLGAYSRSNISRRDGLKVNTHLGECARCAIVASEAREVSRRLALVLVPLTIGSVGMAGYLASLHGGGIPAMALAAMPSTVLHGGVAVTVVPALPTATVALGAGSAGAGTLGAGAAAGAVGAGSAGAAGAALGAGSAAGAGAAVAGSAVAGSAVAAGAAGSAAGAVGTASVAAASIGAVAGSAAAGSVGAAIATGALGAAAGTVGIAGAAAGGVMSGFGAVASLAATGFVVVGTLMAGGVSMSGLPAPLTFSGTPTSVVQQPAPSAADPDSPSTPSTVDPAHVEPVVVDDVPAEAPATEPVSAPAAPATEPVSAPAAPIVEPPAPVESLPLDAPSTPATPTNYDVPLPAEPVQPADTDPLPAPESPSPADEQAPVDDQVAAEPETAAPTEEPAAPADPEWTDPTIPADPPSTPTPEVEAADDEPVTAEGPVIVMFALVPESVDALSAVGDADAPGSEVEPAAGDDPAA